MLKFRNQFFWKQLPGNGSLFLKPNIQLIELFELFDGCNEMQRDAASVANLDRTGERWDWILSMFEQNTMTYQCLSRKSGTTRKSLNVLPEMLKLCSYMHGVPDKRISAETCRYWLSERTSQRGKHWHRENPVQFIRTSDKHGHRLITFTRQENTHVCQKPGQHTH